jgi:NAD(P)-dependent dehydrogenase (short-subunit alcohol dehydrogenase family)
MGASFHKTALITGSTRGIGLAIALRLLREAYNVVINYARDDQQAQRALIRCQQESPSVLLVQADVSRKQEVDRLVQESLRAFQRIDVLINNAACVIDRPMQELTEEEWDRVIDTNLKGTFLCSQAVAPYMLAQETGGTILNIGAATGIRARKNGINTCASKAGIMIMTQCLALELGPTIRVNTIVPGLTRTEETIQRLHLDDPEVARTRAETIPLKRIGTPDDVADAVLLCLSPHAQFITGQKILVDGGQYMW